MPTHIRAVLFDIGGVLLSSPFEGFAAYERRSGLPERTIRTLNATNPDTNAWARLERNDVTVPEFVEIFESEAAAQGFSVDGAAVLESLHGELRPEMRTALEICAAQFKTALLTNDLVNDDAGQPETKAPHFELFDLVDVVVRSSVVGFRKPERRFYELACEQLDVDPSACVFLDDLGVNLKPARAMGMTTIKVEHPATALDELGAVLGLVLRADD